MIIWIASYPKSGNTWVRTIVNQIIKNDIKNNEDVLDSISDIRMYPNRGDMSGVPKLQFKKKYSLEEMRSAIKYSIKNWKISQERINNKKKLTILKTHNMFCKFTIDNKEYSFTDLKNTIGVIHVVRDPRNIATSVKNHFSHNSYDETIKMLYDENCWTGIKNNGAPQFLSSWKNNYNSWKSFPKNNLLIRYEDLIKNPQKEIKKLIKYLSSFYKIEVQSNLIEKIIRNTSFENLSYLEKNGKFKENSLGKNNEKKTFFLLGPKNDWKKILKKEQSDEIAINFRNEMRELKYLKN